MKNNSKIPTKLEKTVFGGQSQEELDQVLEFLTPFYAENKQELIYEYYGKSRNNESVYVIDQKYFNDFRAKLRIKGEKYIKYFKLNNGMDEIIIVYGLENDGGWKLTSIGIGRHKILGKTASQWLLAGDNYKTLNYDIPAYICYMNSYYAASIPFLAHDKTSNIMEGIRNIEDSYEEWLFPLVIETIDSKPEIHTAQFHQLIESNELGYTLGYLTKYDGDEFTFENIEKEVEMIHEYLRSNELLNPKSSFYYFAHKKITN